MWPTVMPTDGKAKARQQGFCGIRVIGVNDDFIELARVNEMNVDLARRLIKDPPIKRKKKKHRQESEAPLENPRNNRNSEVQQHDLETSDVPAVDETPGTSTADADTGTFVRVDQKFAKMADWMRIVRQRTVDSDEKIEKL